MAGKPDLSATSGVQNVVVYVSNDNFAQAYSVSQQNVPPNAHLVHNSGYGNGPPSMASVVTTKSFSDKQSIKPEYSSNDPGSVPQQGYFANVISQNGFSQPVVNDISYQNGAVIKNYGNGDVLSVERQAGPVRPDIKVREECDNRDMYVEPGYMTVMGAETPSQSVRCDSVRSEAAESSCSSLSSADESLLVVQNQPSEMVVYDGSVNVRPAGVVLAVGPPPLQQQAQNSSAVVGGLNSIQKPCVMVPHGWKRLNNGSVIYISPSNTTLSSPEQVKEYLLTAGTCKCGLECHFKYDNVFNFDPKVAGKPWILMPDTNTGDLTKLCNHKRKIMGMAAADCKPPDHNVNKLQRREYIKRSKRKIGLPYAGGVPVSQILPHREKVPSNQHSFNKDLVGNPQQVFPQIPVNNQQIISNRFPNYQEAQQNHHLVRYQDQPGNRVMAGSSLVLGDGTVMVQQPNNAGNMPPQQMAQNHHIPQNGGSVNIQSHQIIGPNGQLINVQGTLGSSNHSQQVNQMAQGQNVVQQPQELHQHGIFINGQPNEPTGPGRPNIQMVPVSLQNHQNINQQRQEMQQRNQQQQLQQQQQHQQQMQFYNNHLAFQHGHPYDPSKNVRPFGQMMQHGFRPHGVTNHPNQIAPAPAQVQNQQQRMQWHTNRLQQTITQQQHQQQQLQQQQLQQQQQQQQQQSNQASICERVPPLHQHTPPPVVWQEELKRKKVKLSKVSKNRPYHLMEGCPTNHSPCPNIDVRQIPTESRAVIINHFSQNNQNSASPSFMEDPSGYLAQQTALLNSTINRQTGANGCTGYVCNSPVTSVQNPQQHSIITVSNAQGNEVPLPSNLAVSQMKPQPLSMPAKQPMHNVNFVRNQQPPNNIMQQQYGQVQIQPNLADSSALPEQHQYSTHCHCCVADNMQQNQYQNQKISSRASSTSGTSSSSGTLEDPVTSSTYSEKQFNQTSPDSRPIQGGTVSTSNVSPIDGSSSNPPTPNPHTPNPHTPNPHTPNPHTPNPHTPNPHTPNPHTPNSHTPNSHTPNSHTPHPHTPHPSNPHTPNHHTPNTHSLNPNPHTPNSHIPNPHVPNPHIPNPHIPNPHTLNPHGPPPPQRISDPSQMISSGVPFVAYPRQSQMHHMEHVSQSRDVNYPKPENVCCSYAHPSQMTRMTGLVTTMASGRTVGSNTITSVLAGRANTATVSINSPSSVPGSSPPNSSPYSSGIQTQAITVNVSKSPLEMVQSVVSSIQVPHSQQHNHASQMSPQIIKHSPTGLSPGHIFVSSGGQLIMASTGNVHGGMMAPPPPKLISSQSGMPPISVSPMVTNVTGSVAQVIPAVAQQVLGQQTVLVNALPAPFVLQPGVTMTMDGMQNMQLPQLVAGNVIQGQIQIDNSDARRLPSLLSPDAKKKAKKKKGSPQTVASMLHIAAQQNSGVVMSQQGFPQQIQMSHSPQGITTGPVMQALTIVPSKTGGPPQIVMNGQAMTNTSLGAQQLITNSQPTQQINLLQPVNLINGATGVVQNFPAIQQFIVPNLGGMVMNPDGTATILQDASNLGMQLQIQNVNGQNVLTPVQNNAMFNGGQSILAAGPAGMVIRAPTSQGKIIQQQQHSPGAQFLSPSGGQFVVNGTQFGGQLSPLVASVSPNQQVTFSTSPQQIRTSNASMQPQQEYIQMNGQMGQTLMVPCSPATNIAVSSSNQQNTTYVQQNTTIVQQQTTMVANNQQLQNFQQHQQQQQQQQQQHNNQQNVARTATLNLDQQNYIVSSNDSKQMQAVIVQQQQQQQHQQHQQQHQQHQQQQQQRENLQGGVNYKQSVSTQTAVNQNAQSVTTNTFCQTSTISAGSPPDTTTMSPLPLASGGQSPPTADTTTHSGSTDDGLSPAPSNCSAGCSDVNVQSRPQSCTMAMVHCISSSEPDSAELSQSSEMEWRRHQQGGAASKLHYGDMTHFGKRSTPTHVAFAESSTLVSGLQYVSEQVKPQDAVISSRNYERMMQHKRKANEGLGHVVMDAHHRQTALFDENDEEVEIEQTKTFAVGDLVWGPARSCPAWPGKIVELHEQSVSVKWFGSEKYVSQIECRSLQTLCEGLDAHHQARKRLRTSRKLNSQLEKAIQEAMTELDKETVEEPKKTAMESRSPKISKMTALPTSGRKTSGRVKSGIR